MTRAGERSAVAVWLSSRQGEREREREARHGHQREQDRRGPDRRCQQSLLLPPSSSPNHPGGRGRDDGGDRRDGAKGAKSKNKNRDRSGSKDGRTVNKNNKGSVGGKTADTNKNRTKGRELYIDNDGFQSQTKGGRGLKTEREKAQEELWAAHKKLEESKAKYFGGGCFVCGKSGHKKLDCPDKPKSGYDKPGKGDKNGGNGSND